MSRPREFWIDEVECSERGFFIADVGYDKPCGIVEGQKIVQLIEKSAYTKLQAEIERCKEIAERDGRDYSELKKQNTKLQAALDVAKEGLRNATYWHHMDCAKECVQICPINIRKQTLSIIEDILK